MICQYANCKNKSIPHTSDSQVCHYCKSHEKIYKNLRNQIHNAHIEEATKILQDPISAEKLYCVKITSEVIKNAKDVINRTIYYRKRFNELFWNYKSDDAHISWENYLNTLEKSNPLNCKNIRKSLLYKPKIVHKIIDNDGWTD
jgi:hypothetical protein